VEFYTLFFLHENNLHCTGAEGHMGRWAGLKRAGLEVLKLWTVHYFRTKFCHLRVTVGHHLPSQGEISKVLQTSISFSLKTTLIYRLWIMECKHSHVYMNVNTAQCFNSHSVQSHTVSAHSKWRERSDELHTWHCLHIHHQLLNV